LRIAADLASNDPAAVAQMYRAAQRMNLNTVGKATDREEFLGLVRDLEGAGCVEVRQTDLATSYGVFSVTEEGHRKLAAPKPLPEASETAETAEEETQRAEQRRPASGGPQEGAERAQSTREEERHRALEELAEERRRREEAERERDELRRELEQLPKPARPWWVVGLLLIVVVVTLVVLSLTAILSPP
jgi:cobalamin biosynthesis Mg chelatase CobN